MSTENIFAVADLPIRLGQFLKLAEMVQDGFEAKIRIQYGDVLVNDTVEKQRGKQLKAGDTVSYSGKTYKLVEK
ncbi:RNA-binding S4 domain-containing protein [Desulfopila sp. IMCC35008]|uniref:RNA-binding S4 domain-containing protein n=1 Tax=Desulfopila sp. IMCC35008 TaxID=2653858 RepID=UPI0013D63501|nr:RNA-binding S4 domain-containing protein [Desulfopila sp. IMCC35008]